MTEYAKPDVLVDTDWLEAHLDDPNVRIIEVDEDTSAYEKGHVRNARSWNWTTDLHTKVGRDYLDQAGFSGLLSDAGVGPDTTVVLYGGNNNWFAAYAYWLLKLRGFDNVKLVNGGRKKWELESRELVQDVPTSAATGYTISGAERPAIRALRDEVIGKLGSGVGFVDVRSPEEYRGEKLAPDHLPQEQSQVPGHIAGAANIPWVKAANDDGTFKSADELRARCTRPRASPPTRRSSPTAGSASARRTRGSRCRSCWATTTSRTTTARGPSTAPSWARPWRSAAERTPRRDSLRVNGRGDGLRPFGGRGDDEVRGPADREPEGEPSEHIERGAQADAREAHQGHDHPRGGLPAAREVGREDARHAR